MHLRRVPVVESEHVGGVVFLAVVAIQSPRFFSADDAHGDIRRRLQCRANTARDEAAVQLRAVAASQIAAIKLQRQAQRMQARLAHIKRPRFCC